MYNKVVRGQYGIEVLSMVDLLFIKRAMLRYVHDVNIVRGMGKGISSQLSWWLHR